MLSAHCIEIVKSTVPVLEANGEILTRHFYTRMFRNNPEVGPLFNPANQAKGTQQKALAAAICAYAANIDNLEVLGNAVELIAQKHASLRILPEHYPIVGENLLGAIREVLGEGATEAVINAWAEAYNFLAKILIGREGQIYAEQAAATNGWVDFRQFKIARKVAESEVISSLYLQPCDGGQLPRFKPGQYLTIRLPHPTTGTTMRNYSISNAPGEDYFRISVKREEEGFVSSHLHQLETDAVIEVGPPCGEFFLDVTEHHERPLVLISAGVGITPMLSILLTALREQPERTIHFVHCALNSKSHAFREMIRGLAHEHPKLKVHYRYSDPTPEDRARNTHDSEGFLDTACLENLLASRDNDYYFCGPKPFMVSVYHQLLTWGIPGSQVHFEFFGPKQELEPAAA